MKRIVLINPIVIKGKQLKEFMLEIPVGHNFANGIEIATAESKLTIFPSNIHFIEEQPTTERTRAKKGR